MQGDFLENEQVKLNIVVRHSTISVYVKIFYEGYRNLDCDIERNLSRISRKEAQQYHKEVDV